MASKEIDINTESLSKDIESLQITLNSVKEEMRDVFTKIQELDMMWDGPANQEFMKQFGADSTFMTELCSTIQALLECMEYARKQYDSCDDAVRSMISSI